MKIASNCQNFKKTGPKSESEALRTGENWFYSHRFHYFLFLFKIHKYIFLILLLKKN